jgi:alkylation response protein AidB-like acyl-CoA dehydrogenase
MSLACKAPANPPANIGVLDRIREIARNDLRPLTTAIDEKGIYPSTVLRKLGAAGAFAQHHQGKGDVDHADLGLAIKAMSVVAQECLSTAFCVWCQDAFGWYLQNTENRALCRDCRMAPQPASF